MNDETLEIGVPAPLRLDWTPVPHSPGIATAQLGLLRLEVCYTPPATDYRSDGLHRGWARAYVCNPTTQLLEEWRAGNWVGPYKRGIEGEITAWVRDLMREAHERLTAPTTEYVVEKTHTVDPVCPKIRNVLPDVQAALGDFLGHRDAFIQNFHHTAQFGDLIVTDCLTRRGRYDVTVVPVGFKEYEPHDTVTFKYNPAARDGS